jgi:serine protease Do
MSMRSLLVAAVVIANGAAALNATAQSPTARKLATLEALSDSFAQIAERVGPAVVQIFVSGYGVSPDQPNVLSKGSGIASGVLIDPSGFIVTNAHVVAGARRIQVLLASKEAAPGQQGTVLHPRGGKLDAQVVGIDSATDLALLKIRGQDLPALQLGDSDSLRQGQLVLAFGSPLGLGSTVTMGVVSAVARQLRPDELMVYVQTDAPINPGSSGGPLVDSKGNVIGINTMILSQSGGSEGLGLAIPSNAVRDITSQLRAHGKVRRGVISVQVQDVTPTMAAALGLPQAWGVIVADIAPQGPADRAGLKIGDIILSTDGKPVNNMRQFGINLYRHEIDATITLEVLRGSEKLTLHIPVIERRDDPSRFLDMVSSDKNLVPQLDILGIDVDVKFADALRDLRVDSGVLVAAMSPDAAPPATRFHPGDVIHAVNGTPVRSLADLRGAVANFKDGDPVVVQLERDGLFMFVAFEVD